MSFSVVIPAYNEKESIIHTLDKIKSTLEEIHNEYEIIVIDDCSTDKTLELLKNQEGIRIIQNPHNMGYGASLVKAIKESKYEWIVITDADGTYPIEEIPRILKHAPQNDMVIGARTGKEVNIPFCRRPAKWFLTKLASFLAGVKIPDLNSGLRVFRKDLCLEFLHLYPPGFSFTSTITVAFLTHNYLVKFVPINYYKRTGTSSVRAYDFINFNKLLIRLTLFFNPIKLFSLISAMLFLLAMLIFFYSKFFTEKVMDIATIIVLMAALQIFLFGLLAELVVTLDSKK